jgi:hypothetical protein
LRTDGRAEEKSPREPERRVPGCPRHN